MPKHHDRRRDAVQGAKEPRPERGRQRSRCGASGTLSGAKAPLSGPLLPQRILCRSQRAAIYEFMTSGRHRSFDASPAPPTISPQAAAMTKLASPWPKAISSTVESSGAV